MSTMWRSRWAAVGAAVAITLGAGGIGIVDATKSSGERAVYTAIEPCRLLDTRADQGIGGRTTPLGPGEVYTITAHGNNGQCTGIPNDTLALELNVTGLQNTGNTHFTIWSGAGAVPNASHVNLAPGARPTPNSVTTELDGAKFAIRNNSATANVIIDIVGIYQDHNHDDRYYTEGEVDAKTWSSANITNEAGVSYDFRDSVLALTSDATAVVSTSMRVPSDGHVVVTASGNWYNASGGVNDNAICQLQKGATGPVLFNNPGAFELSDRNAATPDWNGFTQTATFPVAVADNPLLFQFGQSFSLVCDEVGGAVSIDDVQITATFFPTSYRATGLIVIPFPDTIESVPNLGE